MLASGTPTVLSVATVLVSVAAGMSAVIVTVTVLWVLRHRHDND